MAAPTLDKCTVTGYTFNEKGVVDFRPVTVQLNKESDTYKSNGLILKKETIQSVIPNGGTGLWTFALVENESMGKAFDSLDPTRYLFNIGGRTYLRFVPNTAAEDFGNLTNVAVVTP